MPKAHRHKRHEAKSKIRRQRDKLLAAIDRRHDRETRTARERRLAIANTVIAQSADLIRQNFAHLHPNNDENDMKPP